MVQGGWAYVKRQFVAVTSPDLAAPGLFPTVLCV